MATATKKRSPFQAPPEGEFGAVYTQHQSQGTLAPEEKTGYLNRAYVEYTNPERTVIVARDYNSYEVLVKTDLAITDVADPEAEILTSDQPYYVDLRERGVFYSVLDGGKAKTRARAAAEALLEQIQDVEHPLHVSLDGKFAPALTIALREVEAERDYRRDDTRVRAVWDIAKEAGVSPVLLALAIKEDRLTWSTPPVAPRQVMVVVREEATANLSERLVDEVVLATREIEGLGRIVHEGSVAEYLLRMRTVRQKQSVDAILREREKVEKTLTDVINRAQSLLDSLGKGEVIGRGFHDTLRLADEAEKAQQAATAYAAEVANADLPADYLAGLLKNEYADPDQRYRFVGSDVRTALEALAAINGMPLKDGGGYYY